MSDEARDAYLQWLDKCAKEQETDYETWLEGRVARAEGMLSIAMSENQRLTKIVEDYEEENTVLKWELAISIESNRIARVFNLRYLERADKAEAENTLLKAKLAAIECAGCGKTMQR